MIQIVLLQPPSYCESTECYTPQQDRLLWGSLICEQGVQDGLDVTPGAGMSVDISAGAAFIQGTVTANEGMYWVSSTAVENRTVQPSDPTDDRFDNVAATINPDCTWQLQVITGTPAPNPVPPAMPPNSIRLAVLDIQAGSTSPVIATSFPRPRAKMCESLMPTTGRWVEISRGIQAVTSTPVINIPSPENVQFIRGTLYYLIFGASADIRLRINGLSGAADFASGYQVWNTTGTVIDSYEDIADSTIRLGRTYSSSPGMMEFMMQAQESPSRRKIVTSKFSCAGDALGEFVSGMGTGRPTAATMGQVQTIQVYHQAAATVQLDWLIEGYYPAI